MTIEYQSIFPTAVGSVSLDREYTQIELDFFKAQESKVVFNKSNRTSIDSYLFEHEEMKEIKNFCETSVNSYFQEIYRPSTDVSLYITQSWMNFAGINEGHHQHFHGNSFISGCLYIDVDKDQNTDKINFFRQSSQLTVETEDYTPYNSKSWWLGVQNKTLLMFPSDLTHSVDVNKSDKTRITLSFNTFFKGTVGSKKDLTELKL
jgi:uncharacterized protein (TIGR02466 family)